MSSHATQLIISEKKTVYTISALKLRVEARETNTEFIQSITSGRKLLLLAIKQFKNKNACDSSTGAIQLLTTYSTFTKLFFFALQTSIKNRTKNKRKNKYNVNKLISGQN